MTRNSERTAAKAYAAQRVAIDSKLALLKVRLRDHHGRAAKRPDDWGFPGNLGHIEEILDQALEFLGSSEKGGSP